MRLLIMGPQGVGKGTQAALLAEHFNIPTISTGDIFRYNIKNKTELGLEAMSYTDKGELVPDSLTNKIVKDRLAKEDCKNGWILDGYPRNAAQVTALDEMLADLDTPLDHVVALEAARDVLLERMRRAPPSRAALTTLRRPSPSAWRPTRRKPLRCLTSTRPVACSSWSTASATSTRSAAVSSATSSSRFGSPGNKPE